MNVDIKTIVLILGITHLMQILVFTHQYNTNKSRGGPGWWLLWSVTESVGFAAVLLRGIPGLGFYVILFQDIIILLGAIFIYFGILRFFERPINTRFFILFLGSFVILHLFFIFVYDSIDGRTIVFDVYLAILGFLSAYCLHKNNRKSIAASVNFNIAVLLVHGSIFTYRAISILLGTPTGNIFETNVFNLLQYFDALIVSLLWTFGFILMLNQRLSSEILESKTHFETIFNTSPDAAIITRLSDGQFVDCNEGYYRISGYTKMDMVGKFITDMRIWKDLEKRKLLVEWLKKDGFVENFEAQFIRKNGEEFTGLMSAKRIDLMEVPHIISVTRDISERKLAEKQISEKNLELKKLISVKDRLFSVIAHDLRSPFSTIMGYSDLLLMNQQGYSPDKTRETIETIKESANQSYRLLENLLNWARIQTEQFQVSKTKIYPNILVKNQIQLVKAAAQKKNIELVGSDLCEKPILSDENIIITVMRNLLSNAIKYTNTEGKITVSATEINEGILFSVNDNGIGIPNEIKEQLFTSNVTQSRRGTGNEKGTGLGLSICKDFIEKLGGQIWVESEVGRGTSFYFTVPW